MSQPPAYADEARPAWWVESRPRVGVSRCLLGEPVRFNGGHKQHRFLTGRLDAHVEWAPVCPEVEVGMGTPRETLHLAGDGGQTRLVASTSGRDWTEEMTDFAKRRVGEIQDLGLCGYVLKSKSPSCGLLGLPVRADGEVGRRSGRGLFAAELVARDPLLAVEEERDLDGQQRRESFLERVFAHARLRELFSGDWAYGDLVDFHARHKLQLLAHAPDVVKKAGRVVAQGRDEPGWAETEYSHAFLEALATPATIGKHVDALQHALGQLGDTLDAAVRQRILMDITAYQEGRAQRGVPISALREHARSEGPGFMAAQTYLDPFPAELTPPTDQ